MTNRNHLDSLMVLAETNKRNRAKKDKMQEEVLSMRRSTLFGWNKNYFFCKLETKKALAEGKLVTLIDLASNEVVSKFFVRSHLEAQHEALKWCTNQYQE